MRELVNLQVLRSRRRTLLGILVPLLLLEWVGAAALPCAAMGTDGELASAHEQTSTMPVAAHHDGHTAHGTMDTGQHAACPHCAHAPAGEGSDAAAHAACGDTPASTTSDARRASVQPDVWLGVPIQVEPIAATRTRDVFARLDPGGVPPPTCALHLRHCVFLN